jgi:hypothetical protein
MKKKPHILQVKEQDGYQYIEIPDSLSPPTNGMNLRFLLLSFLLVVVTVQSMDLRNL